MSSNNIYDSINKLMGRINKYRKQNEPQFTTLNRVLDEYDQLKLGGQPELPNIPAAPPEVTAPQAPPPSSEETPKYRFKKYQDMDRAMKEIPVFGANWQHGLRLTPDQLMAIIGITPESSEVQEQLHKCYGMGSNGRVVINYERKVIPVATPMIERAN